MLNGAGSTAFNIIWDILLSFYIIRGAFYYFVLTFLCSLPLAGSGLVWSYPFSDLTQLQKETTILVLFTLVVIVCAQYTMRVYQVPHEISYRLSIGFLGTAFLLGGELAVWTIAYKRWSFWWEWYEQSNATTISISGIMTALAALMPYLLMLVGETEVILFDEPPDIGEEQNKSWQYISAKDCGF